MLNFLSVEIKWKFLNEMKTRSAMVILHGYFKRNLDIWESVFRKQKKTCWEVQLKMIETIHCSGLLVTWYYDIFIPRHKTDLFWSDWQFLKKKIDSYGGFSSISSNEQNHPKITYLTHPAKMLSTRMNSCAWLGLGPIGNSIKLRYTLYKNFRVKIFFIDSDSIGLIHSYTLICMRLILTYN